MRSTLSGREVELAQWLKPFLDRLGHKAWRKRRSDMSAQTTEKRSGPSSRYAASVVSFSGGA